ncbi:MAG: crotonase/enoyl-CoA hydratase family protein [Litoreibacter sp.]|nr:crotonase/enoyl-CoA hydratase family protein [Litoreibacter sp.]
MTLVRTDISDRIATVTLTRPDKMNAVSLEMLDAVIDAAYALRDADIACVILRGEGRAFCAGIDIASLAGLLGQDMEEVLVARSHGTRNRFQEFALAWRDLEVPVIAALHGVCIGAGLQLALGADIRIAAPDTRLSIMEIKWGLVPDMGGMTVLPNLVSSDILRRLIYTGEVVEAPQALEIGLLTELAKDPGARAHELARLIAAQSPSAIRAAKRLIDVAETNDKDFVLMAESREQAALIGTPDQMAAVAKGMAQKTGG